MVNDDDFNGEKIELDFVEDGEVNRLISESFEEYDSIENG